MFPRHHPLVEIDPPHEDETLTPSSTAHRVIPPAAPPSLPLSESEQKEYDAINNTPPQSMIDVPEAAPSSSAAAAAAIVTTEVKGDSFDIYRQMASKLYKKDVNDITTQERDITKQVVLG